jgi:cobalt/nickel transport system permease protein
MHIPDGFLSTGVSVAAWAGSAGGLGYALKQVNKTLGERQVPLMGVTAAFIFAAQMLNFTVIGGTSGHLLGGALAAILLGPWAGMLVLTSVLVIQALLFQDGGLLALGANILNMAVIGVLVGWAAYRLLYRLLGSRPWAVFVSGFVAGWLSVVLASLAAAVELAMSGTLAWQIVIPAMGGIHALIGIGEGLITVGVLAFLRVARPDLLTIGQTAQVSEESLP